MSSVERVFLWLGLTVLAAATGAFAWQVVELFIVTGEMFDALESALEARQ